MSETPSITLMLVIERRDTGASLETLFRRAISADVHLFNDYAAASAALSNSVVDLLVIDLGGDNAPGTRIDTANQIEPSTPPNTYCRNHNRLLR
jgi:hypothetical protein